MEKKKLRDNKFAHIVGKALIATVPASLLFSLLAALVGDIYFSVSRRLPTLYMKIAFILIVGFIVSLVYYIQEAKYRSGRLRKRVVDTLILYWQGKRSEEGKKPPDDTMIETVRYDLTERIKCLGWSDPNLWAEHYPTEEYTENIIKMADNVLMSYEESYARIEKELELYEKKKRESAREMLK